jgi:putative FmdB family regulatory protein
MPMYEYACPCCGRFEKRLAMGSAPCTHACPTCGGTAKRVYSPPGLAFTPASVVALRERDERSREVPDVVRRQAPPPPASRPSHLARLPRS